MYKVLSLLIIFLFAFIPNSSAQCDQAFIDNCSTSSGSVKYIKHFRIRFEEAKSEKKRSEGQFSIMLNKGNHYRFLVCNDASKPGSTIIELANDFSKYGGNFNAEANKEYKAFDFICTKTGPYYLKMFFKDGKAGCGVCVLSLVMD
ncbi:MAG: hypothetical protein JEZ09_07480 [Salinivirgaceae bacterium]|nr:hypothetical protein [Salinivirgaceae bacterium]